MDSKQLFIIAAIIAAFGIAMVAMPVLAQNMTGGNMTGMVGGDTMTGGKGGGN